MRVQAVQVQAIGRRQPVLGEEDLRGRTKTQHNRDRLHVHAIPGHLGEFWDITSSRSSGSFSRKATRFRVIFTGGSP